MTDPQIHYDLEIDGVAQHDGDVLEFQARESLFEGCVVTVLAVYRQAVDTDSMVGKKASLAIHFDDETQRRFRGVVLGAELEVPSTDSFFVRLRFGARIELLKIGRETRLFQNLSVIDVVKSVLNDAQLGDDDMDWKTMRTYAPREAIIQRDESDFAFVTRLLAEEGIGFTVQNRDSGDVILFFDGSHGLDPIDGESVLHDLHDTGVLDEGVTDVRSKRVVGSDAVMLLDYDYKRPSVDLSVRETAASSLGFEVYEHPGRYNDVALGRRYARQRVEELQSASHLIEANTNCARLEPGKTFTLADHPRGELNVDWLLQSVVHRGRSISGPNDGRPYYDNHFNAIPKSVPYRPSRAGTVMPTGVCDVALVTVPNGEEIHSDAFGRVTVRFPWNRTSTRDDTSSPWLRVGQLPLGGSMTIPRKDFEVIIDHELGDLDRPFVAGHLYNGESRVPYALPAGKTRSSIQTATTDGGAGANELRFEDSAGSEEIYMNASRDFNMVVDNDAAHTINSNETVTVGSSHSLSVGADHIAQVAKNRSLSVSADQKIDVGAGYTDGIGGNQTLSVSASRKVQVGADHSETTKGTLSRTVAALQSVTGVAGYDRKILKNATTQVAAAWMEVAGGSKASIVGGSRIETIGALKLVRAKTVSVTANLLFNTTAASKSVKCGGSRAETGSLGVAIQAGGGVSVKSKNVTIGAKTKLVFVAGGCTIKLTSDGTINVKAPNVDLSGVKALNQVTHKSG